MFTQLHMCLLIYTYNYSIQLNCENEQTYTETAIQTQINADVFSSLVQLLSMLSLFISMITNENKNSM